jgi:hypothetical protein
MIVGIATGATPDPLSAPETRNAVSGRKGGLKGGSARAAAISPQRRREIAKKAAAARWGDPKQR